jgi:hypothetical protein
MRQRQPNLPCSYIRVTKPNVTELRCIDTACSLVWVTQHVFGHVVMLFECVTVVKYILLFSFRECCNMQSQDIVPVGHGCTRCIAVRRHICIIFVFRTLQVTERLAPRRIQKVPHLNLVQWLAILAAPRRIQKVPYLNLVQWLAILAAPRRVQKVPHLNLVQWLAILAGAVRGFLSHSAQLTRYYLILVLDRFL